MTSQASAGAATGSSICQSKPKSRRSNVASSSNATRSSAQPSARLLVGAGGGDGLRLLPAIVRSPSTVARAVVAQLDLGRAELDLGVVVRVEELLAEDMCRGTARARGSRSTRRWPLPRARSRRRPPPASRSTSLERAAEGGDARCGRPRSRRRSGSCPPRRSLQKLLVAVAVKSICLLLLVVVNLYGTRQVVYTTTVVLNHYSWSTMSATHTTAPPRPRSPPADPVAAEGERLPYGLLLRASARSRCARFRRRCAPLELSAAAVHRPEAAAGRSAPPRRPTLADALGIDYSNLAAVTAELDRRDLIERYRHEHDRRRYVIELSERGARSSPRPTRDRRGRGGAAAALPGRSRALLANCCARSPTRAQLCPRTPIEDAAACSGEEVPGA